MILDYNFNNKRHQFTISYIKPNGGKGILRFDKSTFASWYEIETGRYVNWNGKRCDRKYVQRPSLEDTRAFIRCLPEEEATQCAAPYTPKLYTFDIETEISDEFPEPETAKFPITTISIVNDSLDTYVLGTRRMDDPEGYLQKDFIQYLNKSKFYRELGLGKEPVCKYIYFNDEKSMLTWFIINIVQKAPILAGWNSIGFDWYYITSRISNYYPEISLNWASPTGELTKRKFKNFKGETYTLPMPCHTLVLDMMEIVDRFDMSVMPIKESLSLDYISSNSVGIGKIKYTGDLQHLFETNYPKYVFYNAIDSVLVQLIDKKFKTLNTLEVQSLITKDKIQATMSKIACAESLFEQYFEKQGLGLAVSKFEGERGELVGAYVADPKPGVWEYVSCNDFSSLYPSTIRTCNISIENCIKENATPEEQEKYKKDPNYFVSVNGNIYKNDKDYAFKVIQTELKEKRNLYKYLGKSINATVNSDLDAILSGEKPQNREYPEDVAKDMKDFGYDIRCTGDLYKIKNPGVFSDELKNRIVYMDNLQLSYKILMNSLYGGSSHVAFWGYKISLANDITGESRNLIHLMKDHIPQYFQDNWLKMTDLHKKLGIRIKKEFQSGQGEPV